MSIKSAELQMKLNELEELLKGNAPDVQKTIWENDKRVLTDQLKAALEEEANQQAHEGRVQEATTEITTRLDTLYLGGQTLRELCADEEAYQILRISFTQDYISQATKNSEILQKVQAGAASATKQANDSVSNFEKQNLTLAQENHRLNLELDDMTSRFNAVNLLLSEAPSDEETEKLKQEIADLKAQLALKAKADEPRGDAKTQIDAMVQERENRKVKITNLRLADPSGINTKDYLATDVLTNLEISIHSNYVRSYKEVTAEEAEQIRADEANKAAEREQSIPVIASPDIPPVNEDTRQDETATDKAPNETDQVDAAGHELAESPSSNQGQVGEAESEVINKRIHALEQSNLEMQTWIDSIEKRVGKIDGMESYNAA